LQHKLKIFCDFDGTITGRDAWIEMGEYFIKDKEKWKNVINRFENLEIGARECFLEECLLVEDFNIPKFNEIIDNISLDNKFKQFVDFCNENRFPLTIISEGMDYYIERILAKHNLDLPFFSNKFVLSAGNKVGLEFPYSDSECKKCGCCKRNLLLNMTGDDEISVLIGDGFSDACVSNYADIVFAKKSLASYCWKNNITYFEYNDFGDIKKKLEKIMEKKIIKPRQNARVNRKNVFLRG
jgi:2-hydroxy-3-keto-5-methylthiopentenyl-1-phosphate phosphatase